MKNGAIAHHRRKAWPLGAAFFSDLSKHRLHNSGDLITSREAVLRSSFNNLNYLLNERYQWMQKWIENTDVIVEIGAGAGLSPRYLGNKIILTDVVPNAWLDIAMDGTKMACRDESVDVVIVSNALHHFAYPGAFLEEASRVLKPDGVILINEAYCSLLLRLILRIVHHEGYSYDVDVFDLDKVANDPKDPWSGNNAVSNLLFDSPEEFESKFPNLRIVLDVPRECLLFVVSGGVTSKVTMPELPTSLLSFIAGFDKHLVKAAPRLFALCRRTVLRKIGSKCR